MVPAVARSSLRLGERTSLASGHEHAASRPVSTAILFAILMVLGTIRDIIALPFRLILRTALSPSNPTEFHRFSGD